MSQTPTPPIVDCACGLVVTQRLMTANEARALTDHIHASEAGRWQVLTWQRHRAPDGTRYALEVGQLWHDVVVRRVTTTGADHWAFMVRLLTQPFNYR